MQKLYESELHFIEACLKVNPKSYGCWHHRTWVNTRLPQPDWTRELGLCDRCLSLDERNCERQSHALNKREWTLCRSDFDIMYCLLSPLLGLPAHGGKGVWCFCGARAAVHRSSDRLQFLQLLQLALQEHPATSAPPTACP